jgi:hypothetical protein
MKKGRKKAAMLKHSSFALRGLRPGVYRIEAHLVNFMQKEKAAKIAAPH